ncbi:unnamed protein product [Amoebophrya sp. A25]|nr:unnamed protein product [Amoebophrya sp. A25]|eukprot:GSA25T00023893001.1
MAESEPKGSSPKPPRRVVRESAPARAEKMTGEPTKMLHQSGLYRPLAPNTLLHHSGLYHQTASPPGGLYRFVDRERILLVPASRIHLVSGSEFLHVVPGPNQIMHVVPGPNQFLHAVPGNQKLTMPLERVYGMPFETVYGMPFERTSIFEQAQMRNVEGAWLLDLDKPGTDLPTFSGKNENFRIAAEKSRLLGEEDGTDLPTCEVMDGNCDAPQRGRSRQKPRSGRKQKSGGQVSRGLIAEKSRRFRSCSRRCSAIAVGATSRIAIALQEPQTKGRARQRPTKMEVEVNSQGETDVETSSETSFDLVASNGPASFLSSENDVPWCEPPPLIVEDHIVVPQPLTQYFYPDDGDAERMLIARRGLTSLNQIGLGNLNFRTPVPALSTCLDLKPMTHYRTLRCDEVFSESTKKGQCMDVELSTMYQGFCPGNSEKLTRVAWAKMPEADAGGEFWRTTGRCNGVAPSREEALQINIGVAGGVRAAENPEEFFNWIAAGHPAKENFVPGFCKEQVVEIVGGTKCKKAVCEESRDIVGDAWWNWKPQNTATATTTAAAAPSPP